MASLSWHHGGFEGNSFISCDNGAVRRLWNFSQAHPTVCRIFIVENALRLATATRKPFIVSSRENKATNSAKNDCNVVLSITNAKVPVDLLFAVFMFAFRDNRGLLVWACCLISSGANHLDVSCCPGNRGRDSLWHTQSFRIVSFLKIHSYCLLWRFEAS